jgi:hypothetical protein
MSNSASTELFFESSILITFQVPGKRYALTLQLMLKRSTKRKAGSMSRSPKANREAPQSLAMAIDHSSGNSSASHQRHLEPFSPQYDTGFPGSPENQIPTSHVAGAAVSLQHQQPHPHPQHHHMHHFQQYHSPTDADNIWRGFETTANEQLPVWISDQSLGGNSFSQNGMNAFLLPNDYMPPAPAPQIW